MNPTLRLKCECMEKKGLRFFPNLPPGYQQCPQCATIYPFSQKRGFGSKVEREQHLTGICSQKCWDKWWSDMEDF